MKTAHIIGGGPSAVGAIGVDLRESGFVIGVNDSFFNHPCDYSVSIDGRWMLHRAHKLKEKNALAWLKMDSFLKHCGGQNAWPSLILGNCSVFEPPVGADLLNINGNNSGLVAAIVAYRMGYKRLFLHGMDMEIVNGQKHWYKEYEWSAKGNQMFPSFIDHCNIAAEVFKQNGIEVFNVCPTSKLECFEKIDYGTLKNYL